MFYYKSTIVNPAIKNVDVYSIVDTKKYAYVNYLNVVDGAIIQLHTIEIVKKLDEKKEDLLSLAIAEIRQKLESGSNELIVPFDIGFGLGNNKITIPQRGDKKKLLELSERNANTTKPKKKNSMIR